MVRARVRGSGRVQGVQSQSWGQARNQSQRTDLESEAGNKSRDCCSKRQVLPPGCTDSFLEFPP